MAIAPGVGRQSWRTGKWSTGLRLHPENGARDLALQWIGSTQGYVERAAMIIDELPIFHAALSAEQVSKLYGQSPKKDAATR